MPRILRFGLILIVSLLLAAGVAGGQEPSAPSDAPPEEPAPLPDPASPLTDPVPIVVEPHVSFTYGGGLLYWEKDCAYQVDPLPVFIRRQPETGGAIQTLYEVTSPTVEQCSSVSPYHVADDDGFFYLNVANNRLDARLSQDPTVITPLMTDLDTVYPVLATDDDYVYVNRPTGLYRANKGGSAARKINSATGVTGLAVDETHIYWLDANGLWRADKACIIPSCWDDKEQLYAGEGSGKHLNWTEEGNLLWVRQGSSGWHVMEYDMSLAFPNSRYFSSYANTWNLGRPVYHDGCEYWLEDRNPDTPLNEFLRRNCGGTVTSIAIGLTSGDMLAVGPLGVVFSDQIDDAIYRLDFDAEAITKDFFLNAIEVTQGIQTLFNTVDLVAKKTTYTRVYGGLLADRGADAVQVTLRGYRDAVELPGSPLYPVGNPRSLAPGAAWDRTNPDDAWLFQLPESWTLEGSLTLRAEVDPHGVYGDPNPGDNLLETTVTFQRKAPICYVFVPVRSEVGRGSEDNPTFRPMVDLAERLLPVPDFRVHFQSGVVEELEVCWGWGFIPYPCYGPYELWQDSLWGDWANDGSKAITSIAARYAVSDLDCDGGRVQFVGMVHEDSDTEGTGGLGRYDSHASWVKFTKPGTSDDAKYAWTWPRSGSTLVHESGHNIERDHVDCGGPPDVDDGYPYTDGNGTKCVLDDGDLGSYGTHFGFDINTLQPIRPDTPDISDLMSYASYRWLSDYTWDAFFDELPVGPASAQAASTQPTSQAAPAQADLASADDVVLISGLVAPTLEEGRLNYAWVYPTGSVSDQVLGKLQALAAPVGDPSLAAPAGDASPAAVAPDYLLRLRDANGAVVADYPFVPDKVYDDPSPHELASFLLTFPAPTVPVAQIDLLLFGSTVDSLTPGDSLPTVEILQPAGGETFDDQMTLVWRAQDADADDRLLFTVHYSPDLGQTWLAIVNDFPGIFGTDVMTLTLDSMLGIPGSTTGALVRVMASDGYNTAMATSNPFAVANQPPQPYILSPAEGQSFAAGDPVLLRGGASDTEDGSLSDASLSWDVTGQATVTGEEVFLAGLAPGDYDVTLTAEDSEGATDTAQSATTVSPLGVPRVSSSNVPELDGFCDDEGYQNGVLLGLEPYPDGGQGAVHLVRSDDYLWACFSGLRRGEPQTAPVANSAGLLIDANYSQEHAPQADDLWVFVNENGTPAVHSGPTNWAPGGLSRSVLRSRVSANENAWTAELRLDASLLGGWNHVVGLGLVHVWVPGGATYHLGWPYAANTVHPDSWATTVLGKWPRIDSVTPNEAFESDLGTVLAVAGDGFETGAVALWNGAPRTTYAVSNSGLLFNVEAGDLAVAGTAEVRVQNPGLAATPSNALTFLIKNPVPEITSLTPDEATAGSGDLLIGINGQDFDDGAEALWNGEPKYTVVNSDTFLRFTVDAADLEAVRDVGVAVRNPEPGGGVSNVLSFTILAPPNQPPDAPYAPDPADDEIDVPTDQILAWQASDPEGQPLSYDVAFGTGKPPVVATGLTVPSYDPGPLQPNTTYNWRITACDGQDCTAGTTWSFVTASESVPNRPPNRPSRPNPSDGLTNVPVDQVLSWAGGDPDGDAVEYTVRLGTRTPPPIVAERVTRTSWMPPDPLEAGRLYYWQITASDGRETTTGPIWSFTTLPANRAPYLPSRPSPRDGALDVSLDPVFTWVGGDPDGDRVTYAVALGKREPFPIVATGLSTPSYAPSTLDAGATYHWLIVANDGISSTTGPLWSFTTVDPNQPPYEPYEPDPAHRETGVPLDQVLTWRASDPDRDRLTYDVYFGTTNPPLRVAQGLTSPSYDPRSLQADTTYYWSVTVKDGQHETAGPTWSFRTEPANQPPNAPYAPYPDDRSSDVPTDQVLSWRCYDPDRDRLTYDLYLGTTNPPLLRARGLTTNSYDPRSLTPGANYYWSISCSDGTDATAGPVWRFQTAASADYDVYLPLVLRNH